ncbi:DUF1643 domain-containing protein [Bacillus glycinifermentans]|uniref:DUF1643 domain-containing protein n=1 Tax=Bacillus TaxID=1386 RepID=UPI0015833E04|nr:MULTISPECIES: DUF1643 domain-containing protein [Bacillus]NUJ19459.1 DUF1643 domain-containing protein [Bacillus glycinifermentans]GIN68462.1 hypothetical protein J41TS2_38830 [Bacillus sonorensis]
MPIYKYNPEFVKEVVECKTEKLTDSIEARYCLSIKLNNTLDSSYVFIMLNPSKADKEISDLTIGKLCKFSHTLNEVGTIHVVNLYPFYETDSKLLSSLIYNLQNENNDLFVKASETNLQIIRSLAKNSKKVILAWGEYPKQFNKQVYRKQCEECIALLQEIKQDQIYAIKTQHENLLTLTHFPRHPSKNRLVSLELYPVSM